MRCIRSYLTCIRRLFYSIWMMYSNSSMFLGLYQQVDTWATRPTEADPCPYGTGKGSGAVFDTGGQWLSSERRMTHGAPHECW